LSAVTKGLPSLEPLRDGAQARVRLQTNRLRPRWNKALSDLWGNKIRSLLVIASIAVGLFAVGMITTTHAIITEDMRGGYAARNPANMMVAVNHVDDDLLDIVRSVEGVAHAEGARLFELQTLDGQGRWFRVSIKAGKDLDSMQINQVKLVEGAWPPGDREIVIERNKRSEFPAAIGEMVTVQLPSGKNRKLKLAGVVSDQTIGAFGNGGFFLAPAQGYITMDTLEWLEQPPNYNSLYVTVQQHGDQLDHLRAVANQASQEIERDGWMVYNATLRGTHDHPNASYSEAMAGVLFMLGALVVFLSAFLITNTLSALLNQQAQQIAVMKTIGARSHQVITIYMALIFVYGLLALLLSLPLSQAAGFRMVDYLSGQTNFDVMQYRTVPLAVVLQVVIALLVPQIAGIAPILRGARVKVQEAISGSLVEEDPGHSGWLDRRLARVRNLSRPLLISLRNTFRRKGRLVLTLITLTLGGSIFIATFVVRASLETYISRLGRYFVADINLNLGQSYRISKIQALLSHVAGVERAEGWAYARSELLDEQGEAGEAVQMLAPPSGTILIDPILLAGRWVQPGDQNAIALSERFLSTYPDLKPGETLRMRVNGRDSDWVVVGFFQLAGKSAGYIAYTNYEYLSEFINLPNEAATYRVIAERKDMTIEEQRQLGAQIENYLQDQGVRVSEVNAGKSLLESSTDGLDLLTTFLLIMALLTALVGSIGLMGTMSMNVLDRTREIGVMRAIGASDRAVMNMVLVEGVLIGLISWLLGTLISVPIGKVMSDVITNAIFDASSGFTFSLVGPAAWLGVVLVLSILASVIPARSAARITIREALAYE
jgi:putative ABC transport system permease protein